jgi:hypothetical protein
MGNTKDPEVPMYRRLLDQFRYLKIDYNDLVLSDFSSSSPKLQLMALKVQYWAEETLAKKTFPWDDYKEFMELVVVSWEARWIATPPGPCSSCSLCLQPSAFSVSSSDNEYTNMLAL